MGLFSIFSAARPQAGANAKLWTFVPDFWTKAIKPNAGVTRNRETRLGGGVGLFHDSRNTEFSWQQITLPNPSNATDIKLHVETNNFNGTFLSVAVSLPKHLLKNLSEKSIISAKMQFIADSDLEVKIRLNFARGPNTYALWRSWSGKNQGCDAGFELQDCEINPATADGFWIDLILAATKTQSFAIQGLSISHRYRAEF